MVTNGIAYNGTKLVMAVKSFTEQVLIIKLFTAIINYVP
jgi:hypothetical protein